MKNILITRSFERSKGLTNFLIANKYNVTNQKLFDVVDLELSNFDKKNIGAIILTSFSSCKAILSCDFAKNIKIFAIGKQSCEILLDCGFDNIEIVRDRSVISLCKMVASSNLDKRQKIIYFRGLEISYDVVGNLSNHGLKVEELICYKTNPIEKFSDELVNNIKNNQFDAILIFSQNSARIFHKIAKQNNLLEYLKKPRIFCFSEAIASLIKNFDNGVWRENTSIYNDLSILSKFYD